MNEYEDQISEEKKQVKEKRKYDLTDLAIIGTYSICIFTLGSLLTFVWFIFKENVKW